MISLMLESEDGIVTEADASAAFGAVLDEERQYDVRRYPGDVLIGHGVVKRLADGTSYQLLGFGNFTEHERAVLVELCDAQIQIFLTGERAGGTDEGVLGPGRVDELAHRLELWAEVKRQGGPYHMPASRIRDLKIYAGQAGSHRCSGTEPRGTRMPSLTWRQSARKTVGWPYGAKAIGGCSTSSSRKPSCPSGRRSPPPGLYNLGGFDYTSVSEAATQIASFYGAEVAYLADKPEGDTLPFMNTQKLRAATSEPNVYSFSEALETYLRAIPTE